MLTLQITLGAKGKAKASIGSWIVLVECDSCGIIKDIKSAKIDGEELKEDTFYKLENGKFIEA